jgi:DNA-binding response OmpR family regulator
MARLLIVDDDRSFTHCLKDLFANKGYIVEILEDGEKVAELLKEQKFDVVVLDNHLNGKSGVEILHLLNRFEENTGWKKPRIVLLTGDNSTELELRARLAKIDFFLLKPCSYKDLEERIEQALNTVKKEENSIDDNSAAINPAAKAV